MTTNWNASSTLQLPWSACVGRRRRESSKVLREEVHCCVSIPRPRGYAPTPSAPLPRCLLLAARRKIISAGEVRKAAEAAEAPSAELRAKLAGTVKVKNLADCLAEAQDAAEVDACMKAFCDSDEQCLLDYADNSCEEDTSDAAARPSLLRRVFGRFFGRRNTVVPWSEKEDMR